MRRTWSILGFAAASFGGCVACAPAAPADAPSSASAGSEQWEGVYQGPYHNTLTIQRQGDQASGSWRSASGRMGEFTGTIKKHRLELRWTERDEAGNASTGRGYFLFRGAQNDRPPSIYGEWGIGESRRGNAWWAVKRRAAGAAAENTTGEEPKARGDGSDDRLCPGCDEVEYER